MNGPTSTHFNKRSSRAVLWLFFLFFTFSLALRGVQISGTVKNIDKNELSSVRVTVRGTDIVTLSDENGKFNLEIPEGSESVVLVFEHKGYHPFDRRIRLDKASGGLEILLIPQEYLLQTVSVTATNTEEAALSVPMAESSISQFEIQEKITENIVETLSDTAGVHFIGSGGYSITPSIRGLARRRVLVLVDGNRITSDRRAGTSIGLVSPELTERIEVVRSASSVLYGSDAIGGVINIITKPLDKPEPGRNSFNLSANSANNRVSTGLSFDQKLGKWDLFGGFQYAQAGDYQSPDEKIHHSSYKYYSGLLGIFFYDENRDFYLQYTGGIGKDVGKPARDNDPEAYSIVPKESEHMVRLGYSEKSMIKNGRLDFSLFLDPTTYDLDKIDARQDTLQSAYTKAFNLGVRSILKISPGRLFSYQMGVDWFSRQRVQMENREGPRSDLVVTFPMKDGTRNDLGFFAIVDYTGVPSVDFHGGVRYTFFSISAIVNDENKKRNTDSYSFFLGATKKLSSSASLFLNFGRAFRFPSLSESYYTGITGRKAVIGNPDLLPESSFNVDGGVKIASNRFSLGLYLFTNAVNHLIERYKTPDNIYTYDNIQEGRIYGGEVEVRYTPVTHFDLFGHYLYYKGKDKATDEPLNDVPAPRFLLGGKVFINRIWFEAEFLHSFKKSDPGPAEEFNEAFNLLEVKGGCYLSSLLYLYVKAANLFNERYYANADPDIPLAKGINISAGLHFYF
jgi:outer membrane receptor protein involved in Fe transport